MIEMKHHGNNSHKHNFKTLHKNCGHGARSKVSLIKRISDGKLLIWKRPKSKTFKNLESFRKELKKVKQWRKFGISKIHARWHPDRLSLLKTYIKGPSLKQVFRKYPHFFSKKKGRYFKALKKFVGILVDSGHYIHDLKGSNLFFDGKEWNVVDTGPIHKLSSRSSTRREYRKFLFKKWSKSLHSKDEIESLKSFLENYCR